MAGSLQRALGVLGVAGAVVLLALAAWPASGASAGPPPTPTLTPTPAEEVIQAFADAANTAIPAGDGAALAAFFAEDGYFADIDGGSGAVFGRAALTAIFSEEPDPTFQVTITDISSTNGTVTGTLEFVDAGSVAAGVSRYVQPFTAQVSNGLIDSIIFTYDESDPETAQYLEYLASQDEDDGLAPGAVTIDLAGDQPGQAFLFELAEGVTVVIVSIEPGAEGVLQPAHLHTGTCDSPGAIVYPLASVLNGEAFSVISASLDDVLAQGLILNVHLSEDEPDVYVSCALVEVSEPEPTATVVVALPPGTGSGASDDGALGGLALALTLGGAGVAALGAAGALRLRGRA